VGLKSEYVTRALEGIMTMKLIGVGLGRTGTASLKMALERIGFGPCYHMSELLLDPTRAPLWVAAAEGQPDWRAIFQGYVATVDYPGCSFWRELARTYPESKLLLSVRDADSWFESTQETIFSPTMSSMLTDSPLRMFFEKTVWKDFGDRVHERAFMVDYFKHHNAAVQAAVPAERLLVYEVGQGWEPLCQFLGVPVPEAPFPRINTREEHQRLQALIRSGPAGEAGFEEVRRVLRDRVPGSSGTPPS
jgi:hypothetical protein